MQPKLTVLFFVENGTQRSIVAMVILFLEMIVYFTFFELILSMAECMTLQYREKLS